MELFIVIAQIIKDLLGSLNPFRLISRTYRRQFSDLWKEEGRIFRIGYVIGAILLMLILVSLLILGIIKGVGDI